MKPRPPPFYRCAALGCGLLYFPCGLVWAYGLALLALPLVGLGFWLLRQAAHRETRADGEMGGLHAVARGVLILGLVASFIALVATK
jgi:hypothetical protein